jgi:hypothetical protein
VFVDKNTKVICQGLTGKNGTFHTEQVRVCGCLRAMPAAVVRLLPGHQGAVTRHQLGLQWQHVLRGSDTQPPRKARASLAQQQPYAHAQTAARARLNTPLPAHTRAHNTTGHRVWHADGGRRRAEKGRQQPPRPARVQQRGRGQGRDGV